jgi:hypothetical protein
VSLTLSRVLSRRIGIAIGPGSLWAVGASGRTLTFRRPEGGELRMRPLEPLGDSATWPDLAEALRALRDEVAPDGGSLAIALLPPLVRLRRVDLPPLTDSETRTVIERSAAKYFTGVREPQAVAASRVVHRLRRSGTVIAAATPARLVSAVLHAARAAGWTVSSIVPAHAAWVAGARAQWGELGREAAQLGVLAEGSTELLRLEHGQIAAVRQFAAARVDQLVEAVVETGGGGAPLPLLTIGPEERRQQLVAPLAERGVQLGERVERWRAMSESPEAMAAAFAADAATLDLIPAQAHAARDALGRRRAVTLAVAAALFLIIGAAARLWDARRELAVVQARREEIRGAVSGATEARGSIELLQRRLAALEPIESRATRWSAVLAEVASYLPRDAYLVSVRGGADTLTVEGLASSAAGVFERLERAPGILSVQPAGSIRRDVTDAGVALERFTLAARLTGDTAAVAPKGRR